MVKVRVTGNFKDRYSNLKLRKIGEVFDTEKERADKLKELGFIELAQQTKKTESAD